MEMGLPPLQAEDEFPLGTGLKEARDAEEARLTGFPVAVVGGNGVLDDLAARVGGRHGGLVSETAGDHGAGDGARRGGAEGTGGLAGTVEDGAEGGGRERHFERMQSVMVLELGGIELEDGMEKDETCWLKVLRMFDFLHADRVAWSRGLSILLLRLLSR